MLAVEFCPFFQTTVVMPRRDINHGELANSWTEHDTQTMNGGIYYLPLKVRWHCLLLDRLGYLIDRLKLGSLTVEDFLC